MWLIEAADATGHPVVIVDGWGTRGFETGYDPHVVVTHHTAGPSTGDMPSLGIITNGRSDLPGPLSNYAVGRSGTIYVVASGKSNNAGVGEWAGFDSNYDTVGIEPENTGSEAWPAVQIDALQRLEAEILRRLGEPASMLCGHKEWATPPGRKTDPHTINMTTRRAAVAALLEDDMPTVEEIHAYLQANPLTVKKVTDEVTLFADAANKAGIRNTVWRDAVQGAEEVGSMKPLLRNVNTRTEGLVDFMAATEATLAEILEAVQAIDNSDNAALLDGITNANIHLVAIRTALGSADI